MARGQKLVSSRFRRPEGQGRRAIGAGFWCELFPCWQTATCFPCPHTVSFLAMVGGGVRRDRCVEMSCFVFFFFSFLWDTGSIKIRPQTYDPI